MRHGLILAGAIAACSPAPPSEAPVEAAAVVPTPHVVTNRISFARNGQRIDVTVGEPFSVELPGEESMGRMWAPLQTPGLIVPAPEGSATLPPDDAPQEAMPGAIGVQAFFFVATAPGEAELQLEQRDFGGDDILASRTFRVTIVARQRD